MEIMTTGTVAHKLRISKDRYFQLEESGRLPAAKRTSTGKRFFLPADVVKLRKALSKLDRNRR